MLGVVLGAASLAAAAFDQPADSVGDSPVSFIVIGDTPYSADDQSMLDGAVPLITQGGFPFVIHIGDFKGGGAPCDGRADDAFEALTARLAPVPVFYTPGDNEWTDCDRRTDPATGAPYSELNRLASLRSRFLSHPFDDAARAFGAARQEGFGEHQTWRYAGVRFVTLHMVGTENGRSFVQGDPHEAASAEADSREAAALAWLRSAADTARKEDARAMVVAFQADPTEPRSEKALGVQCRGVAREEQKCDAFRDVRAALFESARSFSGPILLIHGDTSPFTLNRDMAGDEAPNLWRLNAAGDAGVGVAGSPYGTSDVTRVTVTFDRENPFTAEGLTTNKPAKRR